MQEPENGPRGTTTADMKQACLDLSNAAIALFDLIDEDGVTAPMEGMDGIMKLKAVVDSSEKIRGYYERRNIQRMLALGVSPATLLRMAGGADGA